MTTYNPNSIWDSKKQRTEKDVAPPSTTAAKESAAAKGPEKPKLPETPIAAKRPSPSEDPQGIVSFIKKHRLWVFAGGLIVILGFGALLVYLISPAPSPNVSIAFTAPSGTAVGVPFPLHIALTNDSESVLRNAELTIALPDGIAFVGQAPGQRAIDRAIGDIGPGSVSTEDLSLIATGNPKSVEHVTAKLIYGTDPTAQTQFETDGGVDVLVGQPALSLTFTSPTNIFSGQDFDVTVNLVNTTGAPLNDVQVNLDYPPAFTFKGATLPVRGVGNNAWNIGTLAPGATSTFTVTGNIVGPDQALYAITGTVTAGVSGLSYSVDKETLNLAIASSPLSLSVALNNEPDHIVKAGEPLNYVLTYTNHSNVTFESASIRATLAGIMFDLGSLRTNGAFDSRSNTITWYAANTGALRAIEPGQSGSVGFTIQAKGQFPIRLLGDKNYTLRVNASITSPTVPPNTAGTNTVFATTRENKVAGKILLAAKAFLRDAASGILNTGPYPPKVDQPTEYTIHWYITNYSTDAQNVSVSAYLQSGSTFTGEVKSTVSSTPQYDPGTGLVTWNIPLVPATTGVIGAPMEAVFQVSNTPAVNQLGQPVTLMGISSLRSTDAFIGNTVTASAEQLTTDLPFDTTITIGDRRVTQ